MFNIITKYLAEKQRKKQIAKEELDKIIELNTQNENFINNLNIYEIEKFFDYLNNVKKIFKIKYTYEKINNDYLNQFYNKFFSEYTYISVGDYDETYVSYLDVLDDINCHEESKKENKKKKKPQEKLESIIIGSSNGESIEIKVGSTNNGVYVSNYNHEEFDIDNPNSRNIYYYLIEEACLTYEIDPQKEYKIMKSIESNSQ